VTRASQLRGEKDPAINLPPHSILLDKLVLPRNDETLLSLSQAISPQTKKEEGLATTSRSERTGKKDRHARRYGSRNDTTD